MINFKDIFLALGWAPFFIAPFFWANIFITAQTVNILAFSTGLFASACMWTANHNAKRDNADYTSLLFLLLYLAPFIIHLILNDLRSPWHAWLQTLYLTACWIVFHMSREKASTLLESKAFSYLLATVAVAYVTYALMQSYNVYLFNEDNLFPVWTGKSNHFSGPLMQPNWGSLFLAAVTIILFFQLANHGTFKYGLLFAIVSCTGIFLTASRSGLITFTLGCLLLYWFTTNRKKSLRIILSCILPAIAISIIIQHLTPQTDPSMINRIEAGGFLDRVAIWEMCWQLIRQHPLLGVGWGNLPAYGVDGMIAAYQTNPWLAQAPIMPGGHAWAHNLALQFLVEGGLLGGAAIILLLWAVCAKSLRLILHISSASSGVKLGSILSVMLLAHGMLSVSMMQPFFQILLALFLAAMFPSKGIKYA